MGRWRMGIVNHCIIAYYLPKQALHHVSTEQPRHVPCLPALQVLENCTFSCAENELELLQLQVGGGQGGIYFKNG